MAKITVQVFSSAGLKHDFLVFDKDRVLIGRGYDNDIILQDDYVSARHAALWVNEEGKLVIEDLDSRNGLFFLFGTRGTKKKKKISGAAVFESGSRIIIGNTLIRIFLPGHPVAPAKPMRDRQGGLISSQRKKDLWYVLLAYGVLYFFQAYATYPYVNNPFGQILFLELVGVLVMVVWAGLWALLGRMMRQRFRFRVHFAMTCLYAVVIIPILNVAGFLGFITASPLVEGLMVLVFGGGALTLLLYGHFTFSTYLKGWPRIMASAAIPLIFCVLGIVGQVAFHHEFSERPPYYSRLKPPLIRPLKIYQIDEFIDRDKDVFDVLRERPAQE